MSPPYRQVAKLDAYRDVDPDKRVHWANERTRQPPGPRIELTRISALVYPGKYLRLRQI